MTRAFFVGLAAIAALAADDPWAKVHDLKSGTELRIFKKGSPQPVIAKMDELKEDALLVVVKSEQVAIPKDQIDRVDARPAGKRVTVNSKTETTEPDTRPAPPGYSSQIPGTSTSSGVSIGSKPDFETIYRRPAVPPKK